MIPDVLDHLQDNGGDPDLIKAISYIANNLKEDRARANSYSSFVTYRRIGNRTRKPRRPQIANPFVPLVDDDGPVEAIVITPKDDDPEPEEEPEDVSDSAFDEPDEPEEESGEEEETDGESEEQKDRLP